MEWSPTCRSLARRSPARPGSPCCAKRLAASGRGVAPAGKPRAGLVRPETITKRVPILRNLNHTVKKIQIPIALAAILCLPALCPAQTVPAYTITTVAGNNTAGYSGDAGAATAAELDGPAAVWIDSQGNLYIADPFNNRIRLVTTSSGNITTVAGNGTPGFLGDTGSSTPETATSAEINGPDTVILDSKGNLYIADTANSVVRMVTPSGAISTYAGENSAGPEIGR